MANLIDALDKSVQRYEKRFSEMVDGSGGVNLRAAAAESKPAQRDWMTMLGGSTGALPWSQYAGNGLMGNIWGGVRNTTDTRPFSIPAFDRFFANAEQRKNATPVNGPGTATVSKPLSDAPASWSGPATADDNKTLTAQQIDQWIATTRGNSPLSGMGATILTIANKYGVSAPLMLGIFLKESELGVTAGPNRVLSGIVAPGDPGLGGNRQFNGYASWEAAIDATAANLATDTYKGKSLQEQIGNWYVGPEEWKRAGVNATDKAGNGTVGQYVGMVAQVYQQLGIAAQPAVAPTRVQPTAGGGGAWQQAGAALIGTPYGLGGRRAAGGKVGPGIPIDCSEFTAYLLEQEGISVTWNAQAQYNETQRVDRSQLQPGDLVFFQGTYDTGRGEYITHVGRFVGYDAQGNPIMINSGSNGVAYANLNDQYWRDHYAGAGRVPPRGGDSGNAH